MTFAISLFWISVAILFFCYAGYGLLLLLLNSFNRQPARNELTDADLPAITLIVAAYNEGEVLHQKIQNSLALQYPEGRFTLIMITDGSTDGSDILVQNYPRVLHLHSTERKGKSAAINRAMQVVQSPIVVFSDANTLLNDECLLRIAAHYVNPKTGGVAGEKKIYQSSIPSPVGAAEGLYWQYESFLKRQDAKFHTVVGAAGELFSIRTELFKPLNENIILDDFVTSMQICLAGYTIEYEPAAFATEYPSASLREEMKRKTRIAAGAYQSIGVLKAALNIFKFPLLCFQYISRRMLRWVMCPLMLMVLLISNIYIVSKTGLNLYGFYGIFLHVQLLFYGIAIIGGFIINKGKRGNVLTTPFYFLFMNYCLVRGFISYASGRQSVLWERSVRERSS